MTPQRTINLLRALFVILTCLLGSMVGGSGDIFDSPLKGGMAGIVFGLLLVLFDRLLKGVTLRLFSSATFGLLLGLIAARLLIASNILKYQSEDREWLISLLVYCSTGYLGMMLAMRSSRDEFSLIIPYVRFRMASLQDMPLLVDSNVLIDGRVAEVCLTGFVSSSLIIPRTVMDELQRLADSQDPLKRERGRRGLEYLVEMQRNPHLSVNIHEGGEHPEMPADALLIQIAKLLQAHLLTNDANLCRMARLQSVQALNLNELASVLRPTLTTGDRIELALLKEGRDAHQAVGYLPDGTMIVVNHARDYIGKTVPVTIGGTFQTSAGRMFFAELRN